MYKHQANYTHTYKRIIVQLLLSVVLFANCEHVGVSPNSVDLQPTQEVEEGKNIVSDQEEVMDDAQQSETRFSNLPIELQSYILSFLDPKNFHRASLVCHVWRDAAFMAGEEKMLDLSKKKLDEKDCQVLLKVPFTWLILRECQLGEQEICILSQSARIKHLNLFGNKIGNAGVQALASGNLTALTSLDLQGNEIRDSGVQALARGNLVALAYLNLGWNEIGTAGAQALANGNLGALTYLHLNHNGIGAVGVQALANGNLTALTYLNLEWNKIGDAGAQALASGNLAALTSLHLKENNIEKEGKKALRAWATKKFIKLEL